MNKFSFCFFTLFKLYSVSEVFRRCTNWNNFLTITANLLRIKKFKIDYLVFQLMASNIENTSLFQIFFNAFLIFFVKVFAYLLATD